MRTGPGNYSCHCISGFIGNGYTCLGSIAMVGNDIKNEERCSEVVLREGQKKIENIENLCFHLRFWINRSIFYLKQIIRQKNSKLENFIRVSRFITV